MPGQHGWLAPAGDSVGFAERLLLGASLAEADYRQMAQANQGAVEKRANWDTNFVQLLRAYDQIL